MRAFVAFVKKEFLESWRSYRLVILLVVFALFGVMNPLLAKLTPELIRSFASDLAIDMPEPTELDSWTQFFKNIGQMGMLVLIVVFSGITANEFTRGTLVNLLTKGLNRSAIILAKFMTATVLWSAAYLLCFAVSCAYTAYFWEIGDLSVLPFLGLWLFGLFLIALLILGGIMFKNFYGSLLLSGGAIIVMSLVNIAPALEKYNPISLAGGTLAILAGQKEASDFLPAIFICAGITLVLILLAAAIFRKKQI